MRFLSFSACVALLLGVPVLSLFLGPESGGSVPPQPAAAIAVAEPLPLTQASTDTPITTSPLITVSGTGITEAELNARFVGLLSHMYWLMGNQAAATPPPASSVRDNSLIDKVARLERQIFRTMDDTSEDQSDIRSELSDEIEAVTLGETTFEGINIDGRLRVSGSDFLWSSSTNPNRPSLGSVIIGLDAGAWSSTTPGSTSLVNATLIGLRAGENNQAGWLTAIGAEAGQNHGGATWSTFVGAFAGKDSRNSLTAIGVDAGARSTGNVTTALGRLSARDNSGNNLTAAGYFSGNFNSGDGVTVVGSNAGQNNAGHRLTALGVNSGRGNSGDDVVAIGYRAGLNNILSNQLIIENQNVSATPLIQGDFASGNLGIGTTTPSARLTVDGTVRFASITGGTLETDALGNVTVSSDERLKDIEGAYGVGLEGVLGLDPIRFRWNAESGYDQNALYAGFSAQNVEEFLPEAVGETPDGFKTLTTRPILAAVVNAVQELWERLVGVEDRVDEHDAELADLRAENDWLKDRLSALENELDVEPPAPPAPATAHDTEDTESDVDTASTTSTTTNATSTDLSTEATTATDADAVVDETESDTAPAITTDPNHPNTEEPAPNEDEVENTPKDETTPDPESTQTDIDPEPTSTSEDSPAVEETNVPA